MGDIGLSAFSLFFMGSPSFLAHQRKLEEGHARSNCQTLFGMTAIPSDAYIRLMLDGASPAVFDPVFFKAIETEGVLAPLNRSGDSEGVRLENGKVRSATGFADAWKQYAQGGWTGLAADPQYAVFYSEDEIDQMMSMLRSVLDAL